MLSFWQKIIYIKLADKPYVKITVRAQRAKIPIICHISRKLLEHSDSGEKKFDSIHADESIFPFDSTIW